MSDKKIFITIHGIKTSEDKSFLGHLTAHKLENGGYIIVKQFKYGYINCFDAYIKAWFPERLSPVVNKLNNYILGIVKEYGPQTPITIAAHSFGTIVLYEYLKKFSNVSFNAVILFNSVLREGAFIELETMRLKGQFHDCFNYVNNRDWIVALAPWPFGKAGTRGLKEPKIIKTWNL